MYFPTEKQSG